MDKSTQKALIDKVSDRFKDALIRSETFRDDLTLLVKKENIVEVLKFLKEDPELFFNFLVDITAVDYLKMEKSPRFNVVYCLRSQKSGQRLIVKAPVSERDCKIETVTGVWRSANWPEREIFDMYGITVENHPDLKRLLMPYNYPGHPLRKDYPLRGRGEREVIQEEGV